MLTITAPIQLKCKTPDYSTHEGFYHRISDQYTMINSKLTPEDLLHVMTTPPEYFFGGEDELNLYQQTNVNTHQENKLEVINNLINRIAVSESAQLTYQDRVYITDILQKIGIRNVNEFMKQVHILKEEQSQTNHLIDLYWDHVSEIRQLIDNYHKEQTINQSSQESVEQNQVLHLHDEIMNRLQTAAIYQTLYNFNRKREGDVTLTNTQLKVSEQYGVAQQILLQKLKSEARGEQTPLVYKHENYYENQQLSEEQISEPAVLTQVSSAVLLDLVTDVYRSLNEQNSFRTDNWYHMEQAFYQNAENTMQRIENSISTRYETDQTIRENVQNAYRKMQKNEISMLTRLFEQEGSTQYQIVNELLYQDIANQELVNRILDQVDEQQLIEQIDQLNQNMQSKSQSTQIVNRLLDQKNIQIEQINNPRIRQLIEQQLHQSSREYLDQSRVQSVNVEQQHIHRQTDSHDTETINQTETYSRNFTDSETQQYQQQTDVQNKYLQTVEGIRETIEQTAVRMQDGHPVSKEHREPGREAAQITHTQIHTDETNKQFYDTHSEQEFQYIDNRDLSSVEQELSRINRENINNQSKYIQMMEGIRESLQQRPQETHSKEQFRRESLMALENPTELIEKLRTEGQRQQEEKRTQLQHALNVLPQQTKEIYEIVREYLEAPQKVRDEMQGVNSDMGLLVRDLHEAEQIRQHTELVHKQQEQLHEQTKEVIDRWNERTVEHPSPSQVYENEHTDVTMVHRTKEQQLNEEEIRQLIEQNRIQNRTVHSRQETVTNYDTTQRQFQNVNTTQVVEQNETVNELVRQGIQRELGALSEKIYHKLEKRLETEKRRRGY